MFDLSEVSAGKTMAHFREWAGEIANSYFSANAIPTDTLTKIARSEELTPHQVEVLAAETNKLIHSHKYAKAEDKYHAADFPLADARQAILNLQIDGGVTKVSAHFIDPICEKPDIDIYAAFGVKPEVFDKTAELKPRLKQASEHAALLKQKIDDKIFEVKTAAEVARFGFIKIARQYMIEESNSLDRMKVLSHLNHFVKAAGIPVGKKMLAKLAYVLMKEGKLEPQAANRVIAYFTKEGDEKAPAELISEHLPAQIVNGQHPLYITLKTVGEHEAELLRYQQQGLLVDDKLRILKQKIREL